MGERATSAAMRTARARRMALTQAGATLGTPDYMAPEQIRDATRVGPAADVYALGATLFEILAREPVHPRGTSAAGYAPRLGVDGSPGRRRDVPRRASETRRYAWPRSALDPAARPSAGALADGVQRYLDGDRETTLRRAASAEEVARGRTLLASDAAGSRVGALRAAGRALALDTTNRIAASLLSSIIVEPPRVLPDELRAHLVESDLAVQRRQSRAAALTFVAIAFFLVTIGINGIRSWPLWLGFSGLSAILASATLWVSQRSPGPREMMFIAVGNAALAAMFSRAFGSLIIVPGITCVMAVSLTSYPQLVGRGRVVIALLVASWLVPLVLERAGVLERTWMVVGGEIRSTSALVDVGASTEVVLIGAQRDHHRGDRPVRERARGVAAGERGMRVEIQAWHMRALVPDDVPNSSAALPAAK